VFVGAIAVVLATAVAAAAFAPAGVATVQQTAARGSAFRATDTVPPPTGCERVVVIGDSLMDNARPWLVAGLRDAGFDAHVDAQPSRRIPASVRPPYSGVAAAASVRSTFGEAGCWVVALGSNDLIFGGGERSTADASITAMLDAVTPGARVWWVNVNYRNDRAVNFSFVAATATFNAALAERASVDPLVQIVDWYSLSHANPAWFFDPVHVNRAGSIARAEQTVSALPPVTG
jgi:hypothetical protein